MRISDWSSDVCSSDLCAATPGTRRSPGRAGRVRAVATGTARTGTSSGSRQQSCRARLRAPRVQRGSEPSKLECSNRMTETAGSGSATKASAEVRGPPAGPGIDRKRVREQKRRSVSGEKGGHRSKKEEEKIQN